MEKTRLLSHLRGEKVYSKIPLVELAGSRRILIENHAGILSYSPEEIMVKVQYGNIQIAGQNMMLAEICRDQLVITGKIDGITIHRR